MSRHIVVFILIVLTVIVDYPVAASLQHGLDPQFWPKEVVQPHAWFASFGSLSRLATPADAYWHIMAKSSSAFANGGWTWQALVLPMMTILTTILLTTKIPEPLRDKQNLFGSARFANDTERAAMREGLELGTDPKTGRAVRVSVEGTLVSIAPPRTGKTSGLIIPNLVYPEPRAWNGPAVVIDPKGEVYRAVAERRRALGRRVICLDPIGLAGGQDTWNPMAMLDASNVLYLQRTALALLPEKIGSDESSAYFRNRAADLITGALVVAKRGAEASVLDVQGLLADENRLTRELKQLLKSDQTTARAASLALDVLQLDSRTRDPIKSTASQAFQWLVDERMQNLVGESTFQFSELLTGNYDLFVMIPTEDAEILAPFLRWLLSDLFNTVRRNRPKERIVVFLDEAKAVGRFNSILDATGELPGYGLSLWTFWQSRSQIVELYGENGAATIVDTAEIVTISDLSAVDPEASERWSRAIGNYTARVETWNQATNDKGGGTKSQAPQAAPLMSKEELVSMSRRELLVFPNGDNHPRHPIRLRKTVSYNDRRFTPSIRNISPVGKSR